MFWILALASTIGYTLNTLLMTPLVRRHDGLSIGMYRNLSLGISFLPVVLYFVPWQDWKGLLEVWPYVLISCIIVVSTVWSENEAIKRIPIGIVSTTMNAIKVVFIAAWGFLVWGEVLTWYQLGAVMIVLLGMGWLNLQKKDFQHLVPASWLEKAGYLVIGSVSISVGMMLLIMASRDINPLVVAYTWEVGIGVCSFVILLVRKGLKYGVIERISPKTFWWILLSASPTVIGTGGYTMASNLGPAGLLQAVGVLGIIFMTLSASAFFGEKLTFKQWIGILISVVGLGLLKLVS